MKNNNFCTRKTHAQVENVDHRSTTKNLEPPAPPAKKIDTNTAAAAEITRDGCRGGEGKINSIY